MAAKHPDLSFCHDRRCVIFSHLPSKIPFDKLPPSPPLLTLFHALACDIHLNYLILKLRYRQPSRRGFLINFVMWRETYISSFLDSLFTRTLQCSNGNFVVRVTLVLTLKKPNERQENKNVGKSEKSGGSDRRLELTFENTRFYLHIIEYDCQFPLDWISCERIFLYTRFRLFKARLTLSTG